MKKFTIKIPVSMEENSVPVAATYLEFRINGPDTATPEEALRAFATQLAQTVDIAVEGGGLPRS